MAPDFDLVLSGDSLPRKKPDPLPLLHACEHFGVSPGEFLFVGDSPNDMAAARAAGCPVVCVPYGYTGGQDVRDLGADAIVSSISDLAVLIT
jgi:phosphoglycolate phosphatase